MECQKRKTSVEKSHFEIHKGIRIRHITIRIKL